MGPYDQLLSKGFEKPQTKWAYQTPRKVADHTYGPFHSDISLPHGALYIKPSRNVGLVIMATSNFPAVSMENREIT